jgi:rhamnose utilization protein RhaD (predicted bifunctional aldolase and dehydrogenase)/NAD(P)-dependent dehydrogenase (short-subunit alcohol dehydrogenase family)
MKSIWNPKEADSIANDDLALRVYTSRLLGAEDALVLHGGGNTSVKSTVKDFFNRDVDVLLVKGSGWDLKTIEKPGFAPLRLEETKMMAARETLSDEDMVKELRGILLDQSAPAPSVEAILHAIMSPKYVDHTHSDSVVTLTNNPQCDKIMAEIYPDCLILPYVMPGFILAKQVFDALQGKDINNYKGIILLHHGVFTYSDDAKVAYENMIELVTRAEDYISKNKNSEEAVKEAEAVDLIRLAQIRKAVSMARGSAQLAVLNTTDLACGYASRDDIQSIATRGPITPDHIIRTKQFPVIIEKEGDELVEEINAFSSNYEAYYQRNAFEGLKILDTAPRAGVWKGVGALAFGSNLKECSITTDISEHTAWAIQTSESFGGWKALSEEELFEMEYWSLEQAKLGKKGSPKPLQGKIAIVTGGASGIGKATCEQLNADGAVVVALDISPKVIETFSSPEIKGIICDVSNEVELRNAIDHTVAAYGGLDIIVCNAGIFKAGEKIESMSSDTWDKTMSINVTATQRLMQYGIPYLKCGIDPSILVVGSRNVTAPGPGASAYSASKAAVTQLARVAALELASDGVRVNIVHPDAVFDTELWSDEVLEKSATRYGMSVDDYKKKNLLSAEIKSKDVAKLLSVMASDVFGATTGAQVPIDGGNDRVI